VEHIGIMVSMKMAWSVRWTFVATLEKHYECF
jgi:hypothetical protein